MAPPQSDVDPLLNPAMRFHALGKTVDGDVEVVDRAGSLNLTPAEGGLVEASPNTPWAVLRLRTTAGERVALAKIADVVRGKARWLPVADLADNISLFQGEAAFIHGDRIYLLTFKSAPNHELVSVPIARPDLAHARVEIPDSADAAIDRVQPARDAVYFTRGVAGRSQLYRWPWHGTPERVALPNDGWVAGMNGQVGEDGVTFRLDTWLAPATYYYATSTVQPLGLASTTSASFADLAVDDVEVGDIGVPLTIIHRTDVVLDGTNPTVVRAYGAYGSVETPGFYAPGHAWYEHGGVYAIAHVRGGGEKGHRWQEDGSHANKLNGVHDLIACVDYLIAHKWTTRERLGIEGRSAGGVVVGRALVERPDLAAVVRIAVGVVNPSRLDHAENSALQYGEFGDPTTEEGYKELLAMDPYVHVHPGTPYPAVLFTIGLRDPRVSPWMTAKLAARLQAATTSQKPVLVRVERDAGHGVGSTRAQGEVELAEMYAFTLAHFQ
jgi:prolyl oligopeptidase